MKEKFVRKKCTEDLAGRVFGKLTVLEFAGYKKHCAQWLCQCECRTTKVVASNSLKRGVTTSCGSCNSTKVGNKFGKFTIIKKAKPKIYKSGSKKIQWLCKCECGNTKIVLDGNLKKGTSRSCGNCNPIHIGDKFGKLTALKEINLKTNKNGWKEKRWQCKCDCGNIKTINANHLKTGSIKSCGNCNPIHAGDKFGKLTVLKFAGYKINKNGSKKAQWLCQCECKAKKIIPADRLKAGTTKSCGCSTKIYSKKHKKWFRSPWELNFAIILDYLEVEWQYEPKKFKLSNNKKYIPDFYLPEFSMFIEIKGWWREDKNGFSISKEKTELFKKEYPQFNYYVIDTPKYREWKEEFKNILV